MYSTNDSVSLSSSSSGSVRSREDVGKRLEGGSVSPMVVVERIPMETITEVREDPPEESKKVAGRQKPITIGLRLMDVDRDIVSLERVNAVEYVCHGQEGAADRFFYMYICHFSQLYVQLPLDNFAMGILRLLNVAPTQLHPNSWAYLQAFYVLCQSLYLKPSPLAFLYFYDTRPRKPATWLSLVSRPSICRLDAFTQSFKHFKDGFFKVVVKEGGRSHFLNVDGSTKFSFSWTSNPWRCEDMNTDELSAADREVVEVLMKFTDRLPTKGLVRVYNSVHLIIDIEGHMTQVGKKNLTLFQALRKEKAVKAKAVGNTEVPNLQDSLVEVHVHGGTKRKAELPTRPGRGKDVKKVKAALLGQGLSSGTKGAGSRKPLKEGNRQKLKELQGKVDKFAKENAAWEKEREEWKEEKKRLKTWKVRYLDSEEKLKGRITDLEANCDELKEKHEGVEVELKDLKSCIIQEHINGFQKGVRQAAFFCKEVDVTDPRFDVNKDVVDGQLINEAESSLEEEVEKAMVDEEANAGATVEGEGDKAA
ncbi:hypothetical protein DEO72_LG4g62 [Vigna unguiculata]|uniref:Transposase (putative) gypsy type domain-containing protein n=1 Tax=Vigna unguiculata TaxID=3917 RepID=A0A4D6LM58_VIGUN|nr:hypothetical protein DEO72_LG4g62 [Vigna unguiculata]